MNQWKITFPFLLLDIEGIYLDTQTQGLSVLFYLRDFEIKSLYLRVPWLPQCWMAILTTLVTIHPVETAERKHWDTLSRKENADSVWALGHSLQKWDTLTPISLQCFITRGCKDRLKALSTVKAFRLRCGRYKQPASCEVIFYNFNLRQPFLHRLACRQNKQQKILFMFSLF